MRNVIVSTNTQKVLDFLLRFPEKEYLEREIQKSTGISKAGVNIAVKELFKMELVRKTTRGKISFYNLNRFLPFIKQLKTVNTVYLLSPLIKKLGRLSNKVILYGSCSRGEDVSGSDIDLFIVTNDTEGTEKEIRCSPLNKRIKAIIRTPLKFIETERKEPVFYREVERGIVLCEAKDES